MRNRRILRILRAVCWIAGMGLAAVTDTQTGATRTYFNPQTQLANSADTSGF
jgi:hypothetical protein